MRDRQERERERVREKIYKYSIGTKKRATTTKKNERTNGKKQKQTQNETKYLPKNYPVVLNRSNIIIDLIVMGSFHLIHYHLCIYIYIRMYI